MSAVKELTSVTKRKHRRPTQGKVGSYFLRRHFPNVEEVVDSKKSVQVVVEQADCVAGKKGEPTECALARAARREFAADGIIIGMSYSYIIKGKTAYRFSTSDAVGREITSYDRHEDFAPGTYVLSKVSPSNRMDTYKRKGPHSGSRTENRIVHKRTARVRSLQTA